MSHIVLNSEPPDAAMADHYTTVMEDPDSQNASIKRAYDADVIETTTHTPRKRAKRGKHKHIQQNDQPPGDGAPKVNWNAGTRGAIRTSLGKPKKQFGGSS